MTTGVQPQSPAKPNSTRKLRVLFVCIGNSCRSPMAESIALRDSSEIFDSTSAGLTPLGVVQKQTLNTLRDNGYPAENLSSKAILSKDWSTIDLVINMSGHPKERVFPCGEWHKVEDWNVQDPYGSDPIVYQRIFEDIRTRIELLTARLRETARKE
jgi:protein-tyrosine-phosphatase